MLDNLMTSEEFDKTLSQNADLNGNAKRKSAGNFSKKNRPSNQQTKAPKQAQKLSAKPNTPASEKPAHKPAQTNKKAYSRKDFNKADLDLELDDVVIEEQVVMPENNQKSRANNLKVMFLGGIGEIGKNMTVLEYGDDIIVIDCGVKFPSTDMLGIDLVVPDVTYLVQNQAKLRGFLVTHGHEDHIGSIPYVFKEINAPIYASKMTCGLIKRKLEEHKIQSVKLNSVKPRQKIKLGCFEIEFVHVNHAIPGAFALAIKTPVGMVVHTGDFKIDLTPVYDEPFDFQTFARLGEEGVLLYMSDSTNAEKEGYSLSERVVSKTLDKLFEENKDRRIVVGSFASNVDRVQEVLNLAEKHKRHVVLAGRSMVAVTDVAATLGEMKLNRENIIEVEKMKNYKDGEILILSTGSQGEPHSALPRMASGEFKGIEIGDNDTIIFSSSVIPGNERSINDTINKFISLGAKVIYNELEAVHASGHACKEEMKLMLNLVKPKFFVPVHGEQRQLLAQRETAIAVGMDRHNVLLPELGMKIELTKNNMKFAGSVPFGSKLIDGTGVGEMESNVLKERKQLSEEGLCIVILNVNPNKGELNARPEIISRGFTYTGEAQTWLEEAKTAIAEKIDKEALRTRDYLNVKLSLRKALLNYVYKKLQRRPMVVPIIIETN